MIADKEAVDKLMIDMRELLKKSNLNTYPLVMKVMKQLVKLL